MNDVVAAGREHAARSCPGIWESTMEDLVVIAATALFFLACAVYVRACDRL